MRTIRSFAAGSQASPTEKLENLGALHGQSASKPCGLSIDGGGLARIYTGTFATGRRTSRVRNAVWSQ